MNKKETLTIRQYAKRCGASHETVYKAMRSGKIIEGIDDKTGRIIPHIADMEWGVDFMQRQAMKEIAKTEQKVIEGDDNWDPMAPMEDIPQNTGLKELVRLELLYKARMAKVKVEEAVGRLVSKEEEHREFFEFGKEVRLALQAIPDRIIDQLITLDRNSAHKMLAESINEALEKIATE